jgi:hypothetical protein
MAFTEHVAQPRGDAIAVAGLYLRVAGILLRPILERFLPFACAKVPNVMLVHATLN